jgi:hypothetical protein
VSRLFPTLRLAARIAVLRVESGLYFANADPVAASWKRPRPTASAPSCSTR